MKKLYCILLGCGCLLSACSTDFEVTTDWKDITIVYGLLNLNDTAQYIKINKAYLDPVTNAEDIARIPDSLYYDSLVVTLYNVSSGFRDTLQRVDGNLEGLVKEAGEDAVFVASPNYLYKSKRILQEEDLYRLEINKLNGKEILAAETRIVNRLRALAFPISIDPDHGGSCDFRVWNTENSKLKLRWESTKYSKVYDLYFRFHYREVANGVSTCHTLDWKLFSDRTCRDCDQRELMEFEVDQESFLNFVRSRVKVDPAATRYAQCFDFVWYIGSDELNTFVEVNRTQSSSIVQTQAVVEYTNIEGGRGLFSSRFDTVMANFKFGAHMASTLATGEITGMLNFEDIVECGCEYIDPPFHPCAQVD